MKKIIFLSVFCATSMILFAQQYDRDRRSVPPEVQRSYQRDYPNYYNNATWDLRDNQWHTRYMDRDHGNRYVDVYYDRRGRRVLTQSYWDRNSLPVDLRERIRRRYHNDHYDVYRIERPGNRIFFQITLGGNRKIYVDERGREVRYY
jgi:hypothetical protein